MVYSILVITTASFIVGGLVCFMAATPTVDAVCTTDKAGTVHWRERRRERDGEREAEREREREERERDRETQRETEVTQRDTERHRETQRDTERHRETQGGRDDAGTVHAPFSSSQKVKPFYFKGTQRGCQML